MIAAILGHIVRCLFIVTHVSFDTLVKIGETSLKVVLWVLKPVHLITIAAIVIGGLTLFCLWIVI